MTVLESPFREIRQNGERCVGVSKNEGILAEPLLIAFARGGGGDRRRLGGLATFRVFPACHKTREIRRQPFAGSRTTYDFSSGYRIATPAVCHGIVDGVAVVLPGDAAIHYSASDI